MNTKVSFVITCIGGDIPAPAQSANTPVHTWHVHKWWEIATSGRFYYYNGGVMRKVHEEVSGVSSRLLRPALGDLSQINPLVMQIVPLGSLKRQVWQLSKLGMTLLKKKV